MYIIQYTRKCAFSAEVMIKVETCKTVKHAMTIICRLQHLKRVYAIAVLHNGKLSHFTV